MIYKCLSCGKSMYWDVNSSQLKCECGNTQYKEVDNMSDTTCDNCGSKLKNKNIIQVCENCGSHVINSSIAKGINGISIATIDSKEVTESVMKYINDQEFTSKPKKIKVRLKYIPYWLVDGTCWIQSKDKTIEVTHKSLPVYADIQKNTYVKNSLVYNSQMDYIEKFDTKYLCGYESSMYDTRDQVITRLILDEVRNESKIRAGIEHLNLDDTNIEFEQAEKMLVLMPLYEVMADKLKLYVNGQTGTIHGKVPKNFKKVLEFNILKYLALSFVIFTVIFMGGAFQL